MDSASGRDRPASSSRAAAHQNSADVNSRLLRSGLRRLHPTTGQLRIPGYSLSSSSGTESSDSATTSPQVRSREPHSSYRTRSQTSTGNSPIESSPSASDLPTNLLIRKDICNIAERYHPSLLSTPATLSPDTPPTSASQQNESPPDSPKKRKYSLLDTDTTCSTSSHPWLSSYLATLEQLEISSRQATLEHPLRAPSQAVAQSQRVMPPRKSNVSTTSAVGDDSTLSTIQVPPASGTPEGKGKEKETAKKDKDKDELAIEDLTMPRTMVQRLAKGVLPPNTQIQKDAVTALSKGATTFISYISTYANDSSMTSNRKTIGPNDVFNALRSTEFEFMIPRLEAELAKYNEIQTGKRNEYRKKVRESAGQRKSDGGEEIAKGTNDDRSVKRIKGESGEVVDGDTTMEDQDIDMEGQDEEEQEEEPEEEEEEDAGDETEEEVIAMEEDHLEEKPVESRDDGSDEESD